MRLRAEVPAETVVVVGLDDSTPGARRDRRDHRRRPGAPAAVEPGRLGRHHPRRAPGPRGARRRPRRRSSASPPSSAAPTCAAWPSRCSPRSASRSAPPASACTTAPARHGGVLDGWLVDERDADARGRRARGRASRCAAVPLMMTDHDATAAMAAAAIELVAADAPTVVGVRARRRAGGARRATTSPTLLLPLVDLADGDIVVVTSKVVSKAEGRVRRGRPRGRAARRDRAAWSPAAARPRSCAPGTGLTMAAAGIDASNVEPRHRRAAARATPTRSARAPARRASPSAPAATSASSSPTPPAGPGARARPTSRSAPPASSSLEEYAGRVDAHGNELAVTAPAVADEIAGAAELAQGKLGGRPFAVVRGRADLVLPPGDDGPGAAALVRPEGGDLFGYGAREAVVRARPGRRRRRGRRSARPAAPTSWSPRSRRAGPRRRRRGR